MTSKFLKQTYKICSFLWFMLNRMGVRSMFCGVPQLKCDGGRREPVITVLWDLFCSV